MLGLNEQQLFSIIDQEISNASDITAKNIEKQGSLEPRDILIRLAAGISKAIEANNQAIEEQLKK